METAAAEVRASYLHNVFPGMKVTWEPSWLRTNRKVLAEIGLQQQAQSAGTWG